MQGELAVMDRTGDTKTIWDSDNKDEVEIAREQFDKFKAKGYLIYNVAKGGEKGEQMLKFDKNAEKMIAVPKIVGG
jgi:predicted acetyltransferase